MQILSVLKAFSKALNKRFTLALSGSITPSMPVSMSDKILLRKRSIIETINDELKNICQIERSRHRSVTNFITNIISALIAYSFLPKKPSIKYETEPTHGQLALF